jgi:hypothetical protein
MRVEHVNTTTAVMKDGAVDIARRKIGTLGSFLRHEKRGIAPAKCAKPLLPA